MSKSRFSVEQKIRACQEYISGKKSAKQIANEFNLGKQGNIIVRTWARIYQVHGANAFSMVKGNRSYSKELKIMVVNEYLSGKSSLRDLMVKHNIPGIMTVQQWIMKYNNHIELKDYDPKPEVYMADTKKTTYEERIEIVKDCLAHGRDIKETATKYGCKYAQLYQWLRKFEVYGEKGLIDKRGRRRQADEITDLEKAERKIAKLEREKEEFRKKYELLKKAEKLERW